MTHRFEELAGVEDAELQRKLPKVTDTILAAALLGAPGPVAAKIIANLSRRRREAVCAAAEPVPERTREVARLVLLREVFGGEGETPDRKDSGGRRKDVRNLLEKLSRRHPDFRAAREARQSAGLAEFLRRLSGGS